MNNEHFLVIGGTTGSGRALARQLSDAGQRVTVIGRRGSPDSAGRPNLLVELVDLMDPSAVHEGIAKAVARHGPMNHVVFFQRYRGPDDPWAGELAVALTATKVVIEACQPYFQRGRNQAIVATGSAACRFVLSEQPVGYHAVKAALLQMIRYYAVRLGPVGVRANVVSPDTVIKDESRNMYEANRELTSLYESITPLGRMGTAEDVAGVVRMLCSPDASFITGQEIVVDGGISLVGQAAVARKVAGLDKTPLNR